MRARALEFAGVAIVALSLAAGMVALVTQALATPLHQVRAALGG